MDMRVVLDRIDQALAQLPEAERPSERSLALEAGLSGDAIRNWRRAVSEKKKVGANIRTIAGVAKRLGVSAEWLMGDDVPPVADLTPAERELVDAFRKVPEDKRAIFAELIEAAKALARSSGPPGDQSPPETSNE